MAIRVVTGSPDSRKADPLTEPILAYLAEAYGMSATHIRGVTLRSDVGAAQVLVVTLNVQVPPPVELPRSWPEIVADDAAREVGH